MCDKLALQYFEYDASEARHAAPSRTCKIKCLSCNHEIKYDGSTGNLIKHLRTNPHIHSNALQHYFEQKKDRTPSARKRKYDYNYVQQPQSISSTSPTLTPCTTTTSPIQLATDFNNYLLKLETLTNCQQLDVFDRKPFDDLLTTWICVDPSTSMFALESSHLKELLFNLNPGYTPLTRRQLVHDCVPKLYSTVQTKIKNILNKCDSVNILCEVCSNSNGKLVVTLSSKSIDSNWSPVKHVLKCFRLNLNPSSVKDICDLIFRKFNECMSEYQIENKVLKVITDDGSGLLKILNDFRSKLLLPIDESSIDDLLAHQITNSCHGFGLDDGDVDADYDDDDDCITFDDDLNIFDGEEINPSKIADDFANMDFGSGRYVCAANKIQKVINDTIRFNEFEELLAKCRNIFLKAQNVQSFRLKLHNLKKTCSNPMGFSSVYMLVKAVLSLTNKEFEDLMMARNLNVRLTVLDREKLQELSELFEDLYICLNHITNSEGHVTISKILPAIRTVLHHLTNRAFKHFDEIRIDLVKSIESNFSYLESDYIFGIASMLDPNYSLSWSPLSQRKVWFDRLKAMVTMEVERNQAKSERTEQDPSRHDTSLSIANSSAKWIITFQDDYENELDKIEKCLNNFLFKCKNIKNNNGIAPNGGSQQDQVDVHIDPLKFWKEYENEFELLSPIAKRLFGIPASLSNQQKPFPTTHTQKWNTSDSSKIFFLRNNKDLID
jgi:hypothetical protein